MPRASLAFLEIAAGSRLNDGFWPRMCDAEIRGEYIVFNVDRRMLSSLSLIHGSTSVGEVCTGYFDSWKWRKMIV